MQLQKSKAAETGGLIFSQCDLASNLNHTSLVALLELLS